MREMDRTGFMHNYMRMYWGKKILEWTRMAGDGVRDPLELNNRYFLDGRDPELLRQRRLVLRPARPRLGPRRPMFGKIRYMNAAGLERKFDIGRLRPPSRGALFFA